MHVKLILYAIVAPVTLMALLSLNINRFFKKNKIFETKLLYFLLTISVSYLVVNFIYDFIEVSSIY